MPVVPAPGQPSELLFRTHARFLQMPNQIVAEECLQPGRKEGNAISSIRPPMAEVSKAASASLPSPSWVNLEGPVGEPAPQWDRHQPDTWGTAGAPG